MTTTLQIEEGKFYRTRDGRTVGPIIRVQRPSMWPWSAAKWHATYRDNGTCAISAKLQRPDDLVEEVPNPAIEDDGFVTVDPSVEAALAGQVSPAEAMQDLAAAETVEKRASKTLPELAAALGLKDPTKADPVDIKTVIADEAKRIVSGARRAAYGTPESNFERISAMWTAYAKAKGWPIEFTAGDVSPMMILMKIARVVESPAHYDSWVDIAGYCLTGAEVNGVSKPA